MNVCAGGELYIPTMEVVHFPSPTLGSTKGLILPVDGFDIQIVDVTFSVRYETLDESHS